MPQRSSVIKHMTPIQGDDAYVVLKQVTYGDIRSLLKDNKVKISADPSNLDGALSNMEFSAEMVRRYVIGWNWVDDDGNSLPTPQSDPKVVDNLTQKEVAVICKLIMAEDDVEKKSPT